MGAVVAHEDELTEAESEAVASAVREHLARRRMSRQRLADEAKISISTLEKVLGGTRPFTLATLVRLESALGVPLRPPHTSAKPAPKDLGAYSRASVSWLEGDYLTLRPSFEVKEAIYAYRTAIRWDEPHHCLTFAEAERLDAPNEPFQPTGDESLPSVLDQALPHKLEIATQLLRRGIAATRARRREPVGFGQRKLQTMVDAVEHCPVGLVRIPTRLLQAKLGVASVCAGEPRDQLGRNRSLCSARHQPLHERLEVLAVAHENGVTISA